jgi:hypothetical protein
MPGRSVVFNSLSFLYFEIESSGGDALSFANPLAIDQLSLGEALGRVWSSSPGTGLPLPLSVHRK